MTNLDKTDKKILEILQQNGKITNSELAKQINISASPTLERVKKLEKRGFIRQYVALVDPHKVGVTCFTYVEVTLKRHGKDPVQRFTSSIIKLEEVMECHHITGEADFLLKVATKDIPKYEDFIIHKLTALEDVQHLKTLVVLSTLKQETKISVTNGDEAR
ncbi:MAG: Lrp/AsnC family transcriptional regulator [Candidatus Marinimicrobia bacterium]|nr:Lrp/AsnC family transcriptional regulator [Candidatus Neomarinimicrobiota bacterium]MBL7059771.1 Lrp/AsnC family transcriptional regulator [Candidatus Neomarinimicrobiota bacterium]